MRRVLWSLLACLATVTMATGASGVGQDPGLPRQWGMAQIGAPTAWQRSVGAGTPIAIIDTGIDLGHEDLRGQIAAAVTCIDTRGDPGRCRVDGADIHGHGSHVAGIAAAASNNLGVAGVAPSARLIAVRVFTEETEVTGEKTYGALSSDVNAGIRWVLRNVAGKGAINLSLGGNFVVTTVAGAGFEDGVEEAWAAGWTPVLAAGNENTLGFESNNYGSLNALVVGATGPDDRLADEYSNSFGNAKWGMVAPGGNASPSGGRPACEAQPERCILSTYKGNQYGYLQGTSMATPHVSGAVALVMSMGLSNAQAVARILETANKGVPCGSGCKGRLDVARAVGPASASSPAPAPPAPSAQPAPSSARAPGATQRPPRPASPGAPPTSAAPAAPPASEPAPPADDGADGADAAVVASPNGEVSAGPARRETPEDGGIGRTLLAGAAVLAAGGAAVAAALAWRRRPAGS